ncbi:bifunctional 2',3'-cyclic-nucleotide 2'-phosphodiesterase/3'-nucleotidase [Paracoccus siganidrum]|uniref:Bifunctional 2',3'-cyclic-nucleotide 2'-phosphodiesterase/3'-nucleotidase n=1 Tax=Paracoccus siganidrum TaxID=1276757 RepID=A0A419AA08_9RHOB|nr:bifunctional 2',3'-cyclic-nucleotide 2'-phosphodiesterase/3'-nucleotidase [Paracoccus siganidrum]RJL19212.1 bifunctional 2',3'-cyclic-nucleotide 2'-phosphodiesterase/3'-nucleotidase [Paracoccus siganidrum]RMC39273.1 bifunctional 2',3'-cyclic-nucleotide 2'-phosphodiesterase/3'-nucleotidase [Paracoccus siganidrum]
MADGSGDSGFCQGAVAQAGLSLRIMATTDMHMHVLPYNYLTDRPCNRTGLARTASLVARRRAEAVNSLLLDNGDFLQGNPLGDFVAGMDGLARQPHPAIASMNAMGYDAGTLGNHDFNFGLPFLRRVLAQAAFPVVAANLRLRRGPGLPRYVILRRQVLDQAGRETELRIGIAGFLPPQTAEWDRDLSAHIECGDIIEAARAVLPEMRADGAQLVVALAHSGIGPATPSPRMEHAATALAGLEGIDVVIAGHSHQVFPGPQIAPGPGIDPLRGTLAGKPAVMAGFGGSHLGVIDLELRPDPSGPMRIAGFSVRAERVCEASAPAPGVAAPALPAHRATLRHYRRRIGHVEAPLHSFFSLIGEDPGLRLVNMAQRWHVRRQLRGTALSAMPVLSAAAPFRAGGRGGPEHYTDVAAGTLTLRNLADLYLFPNRICAIFLTGAQLAEWLERSASIFRQVRPGWRDQPLIDPDFPGYNFDVIDGVDWQVDLAAPPRYAPDGRLANPHARRIGQLTRNGQPVRPEDRFLLATNSYRLASCGLFSPLIAQNRVALNDGALTRDVLRHYVRRRRRLAVASYRNWGFRPMPGTSVLFETGPAALPHLDHVGASLPGGVEYLGLSREGFARLRLTL